MIPVEEEGAYAGTASTGRCARCGSKIKPGDPIVTVAVGSKMCRGWVTRHANKPGEGGCAWYPEYIVRPS